MPGRKPSITDAPNKKPKVVFAAEFFYPLVGGAEHTAYLLLKKLADHGYPAAAICTGKPACFTVAGVTVEKVVCADDMRRAIQKSQPDVLLTQLELAPLVIEEAKKLGIPALLVIPSLEAVCPAPAHMPGCNQQCEHCPHRHAHEGRLQAQRWAVENAAVVLCCSGYVADTINSFFGINAPVWHPPIEFSPEYIGTADEGHRQYITMCTAALFKGVQTFAGIAGRMPGERFLIVGRGSPEAFGLDKHHNITCWPDTKPHIFYDATKVMLIPSLGPEAFGRTALEAMANGIPVMASRIGGLPEAVGNAGILIDDYLNPDAWVAQLELLIRDRTAFRSYVERGLRHCRQFSLERLFPRFERMLLNALGAIPKTNAQQEESGDSFCNDDQTVPDTHAALHGSAENRTARRSGYAQPPREKLCIVWEGAQFVHHSLALVNRELCLCIIAAGHELSILPCEPDQFSPGADTRLTRLAARISALLSRMPDVHIRHRWPPDFTAPTAGHLVVIQPWEFGSIPRKWIEPMKSVVDEIWVPTRFVRESFVRSGIPEAKVHIVPNGVDTEFFHPQTPPLRLTTRKRFKFLFVGGTIYRKGIDILLKAYLQAFTGGDDVCLVIKDVGFYREQAYAAQIRQQQAQKNAPEILYLDENMLPGMLPGLYAACDCFVYPYRGEGFALPIAEAMACGLPVIVTGSGACLDFCTDQTAFLIPSEVVSFDRRHLGDLDTIGRPFLAEPDGKALALLMRAAYENPDAGREKGCFAAKHIKAHFSWDQAAQQALTRLQELKDKPILRFSAATAPTEAHRRDHNQLLRAGKSAKAQGDLEAAAGAFKRATGQFPDMDEGHALLGSTLIAMGKVDQAVPVLRRAAELAPWLPARHLQLGKALCKTNDMAGAEQAFQKACQADPGSLQAVTCLVDIYRKQGKCEEAQAALKAALHANSTRASVVAILGDLSMQTGFFDAVRCAMSILESREPAHPVIEKLKKALSQNNEP